MSELSNCFAQHCCGGLLHTNMMNIAVEKCSTTIINTCLNLTDTIYTLMTIVFYLLVIQHSVPQFSCTLKSFKLCYDLVMLYDIVS